MISARSRLLKVVVLACIVIAAIEMISLVFMLALGQSLSETREMRRIAAGGGNQDQPRIRAGRALTEPIVLHPYLGFVYSNLLTEDQHGFFGEDILLSSASTDFNVVIVGGSVAANFFIDQGQELASRLSDHERTKGKKINVFTFSVGGWHQPQQLLAVTYFLSLGAKIDLLINIDGYNEASIPIGQVPSYSMSYPRAWPALTDGLMDGKRRLDVGRLELLERTREGCAQALRAGPLRYSISSALVWKRIDRILEKSVSQVVSRLEENPELLPFQQGYLVDSDTTDTVFNKVADLWLASSKLLFDMQTAKGDLYIHVLQPNQYVPDSKRLTPTELRNAYQPDSPSAQWARTGYAYLVDRAPALVDHEIAYLDARMIFQESESSLYTDPCCHFNQEGNAILLDHLVRFLADRQTPHRTKGR